jgi:hypothetical protein
MLTNCEGLIMQYYDKRTIDEAKRIINILDKGGEFYRYQCSFLLEEMISKIEAGNKRIKELEENIKDFSELRRLIKKLSAHLPPRREGE